MLRMFLAIAYVVTMLAILAAIIGTAALVSSGYVKIGVELDTEIVFNIGAAISFFAGVLVGFALHLGPKAHQQTN